MMYKLLIIMTLLLCGCTKKVTVPVEHIVYRTDTMLQLRELRHTDTVRQLDRRYIFRYDSIVPIVDSAGRVTGYDRHHYRFAGRDRDADVRRSTVSTDTLQHRQMSADKRVEEQREKSSGWIWWIVTGAFIAGFILRRVIAPR